MPLRQSRISRERRLPARGGMLAHGREWDSRCARAVAAIEQLTADTAGLTCGELSEMIDEGDILVTCEALEGLAGEPPWNSTVDLAIRGGSPTGADVSRAPTRFAVA